MLNSLSLHGRLEIRLLVIDGICFVIEDGRFNLEWIEGSTERRCLDFFKEQIYPSQDSMKHLYQEILLSNLCQ